MGADMQAAHCDMIVEIVTVGELLNRRLIGTNGLDGRHFLSQRLGMWTAPTPAAAGAYVAWHSAYYSMSARERQWLARAIARDLDETA